MSSLFSSALILLTMMAGILFADAIRFDSWNYSLTVGIIFFILLALLSLLRPYFRFPFLKSWKLVIFFMLATLYTFWRFPDRHFQLREGDFTGRATVVHVMPALGEYRAKAILAIDGYSYTFVQLSLPATVSLPPLHREITFSAKLYRPQSYKNIGVPDRERQLARQGIMATGPLRSWQVLGAVQEPTTLERARAQYDGWLVIQKEKARRLLDRVEDREVRGFLYALTLGDISQMSSEMRTRWQEMGIYHLVVISGLHLILFYLVFYKSGYWFSALHPIFWKRWARQDMASVWGCIGIVFPVLFYPPTASLYRAFWSLLLVSAFRLMRVPITAGRVLCGLCLLFLIQDPRALFDLSFQMSFLCLFSIFAIGLPIERKIKSILQKVSQIPPGPPLLKGGTHVPLWQRGIKGDFFFAKLLHPLLQAFISSLAVFIGLLPITAALQGRVHFIGLLLNLVLIPLCSFIITPLWFIVGAIGFYNQRVIDGFAAFLKTLFGTLHFIYQHADLSMLNPFETPRWGLVYWLLILICLALSQTTIRRRWLWQGGIWSLALIAAMLWPWVRSDGVLKIVMFDMGQGESILISLPGRHYYLIDGGGAASASFDIGRRVLVPALRAQGIDHLDGIILTHPDGDHYVGLRSVIETFPVKVFWWSGDRSDDGRFIQLMSTLREAHVAIERVSRATPVISLSPEATLHILYPHLDVSQSTHGNDTSIVAKLQFHQFSMLFTGDIERLGEATLVYGPYASALSATVLKVPHHGSHSSSSEFFLDRITPQLAIASMGRHNRFGHPHPDIIARYQNRHIPLLRTDEKGEITIETTGSDLILLTRSESR